MTRIQPLPLQHQPHRLLGALALGAAVPGAVLSTQPASAQVARHLYAQLPPTIHAEPGTARIIARDRCDRTYPMDEWQACGTETGGPVGGRN